MIATLIALTVLIASAAVTAIVAINLGLYRRLPADQSGSTRRISVLIPARDEEASIGHAVASALNNCDAELEVIVLDDHSKDRTAEVVQELAEADDRVRLESAPALPPDWCGKQHACWTLSQIARFDILVWIDADVRLTPNALSRMAGFLVHSRAGLISGIPHQQCGSIIERAVIPMIHFVLLAYLPMGAMRKTLHPALGAGCGQLFMATRQAYRQAGGHAAIASSLHDGVKLPRAFRRAGTGTDLFDATDVATCRMYRGGRQVIDGFSKNATEGLATPVGIWIWTALLLLHLAPWIISPLLIIWPGLIQSVTTRTLWHASFALSVITTAAISLRMRNGLSAFLLHPVGILILLGIQWHAFAAKLQGRPVSWKNRTYSAAVR